MFRQLLKDICDTLEYYYHSPLVEKSSFDYVPQKNFSTKRVTTFHRNSIKIPMGHNPVTTFHPNSIKIPADHSRSVVYDTGDLFPTDNISSREQYRLLRDGRCDELFAIEEKYGQSTS